MYRVAEVQTLLKDGIIDVEELPARFALAIVPRYSGLTQSFLCILMECELMHA